jgi:hypothetical protein
MGSAAADTGPPRGGTRKKLRKQRGSQSSLVSSLPAALDHHNRISWSNSSMCQIIVDLIVENQRQSLQHQLRAGAPAGGRQLQYPGIRPSCGPGCPTREAPRHPTAITILTHDLGTFITTQLTRESPKLGVRHENELQERVSRGRNHEVVPRPKKTAKI